MRNLSAHRQTLKLKQGELFKRFQGLITAGKYTKFIYLQNSAGLDTPWDLYNEVLPSKLSYDLNFARWPIHSPGWLVLRTFNTEK